MNLDELKPIWNAQAAERLFAIDEAALHDAVRRKGRTIGRMVGLFETMMTLIVAVVGLATLVEPVLYQQDLHQLPSAIALLVVAGYLQVLRARRLEVDRRFPTTLLGDVEKAIARIDYQILRLRSFGWWFILPMSLGAGISLLVLHDSKPLWIWPVTTAAMVIAWLAMRRDLERLRPRRAELETLRRNLQAPGDDGPQ